jgi:hypothetical protein
MLNKGSERYQSAVRNAVDVARAIVEKREGISAGSRLLAGLAHVLVPDWRVDPDFVVIGGFDSESDRFPLGKVRDSWDPTALKALDLQREDMERRWEARVMAACHSIVARFGAA